MPFTDGNAERRNLTILSLSIIVFFLGDAELEGDRIGLPLINVVFTNHQVLIAIVWAMLAWFVFRHWQENHDDYVGKLNETIRAKAERSRHVKRVVKAAANKESSDAVEVEIHDLRRQPIGREWKASFTTRRPGEAINTDPKMKYFVFKGWKGRLSMTILKMSLSLTNGFIIGYWTPYVLCFFAVILGIDAWCTPNDLVGVPDQNKG